VTVFRPANCDRTREAISRSLDGELSPFEERLVGAHLAGCAACAEFDVDVRATTEMLRSAPPESIGRLLVLPRRRSVQPLVGSAAAAAAVAAVLLGTLIGATEVDRGDGTFRFVATENASAASLDDRYFRPMVGRTGTFDVTGGSSDAFPI
jgi:predicted anti-sigma-YlaC factor YlaD